ncbi:MAG: PorV/PorQ family protein [Bacteroidota bacterium]|nr:PorV/PorQ family protein [Bacteroidota bacterium]MDX5430809.1 PorV/PorQ family protein [Bacteroidota bacterium]MDX5469555.1 PorV/PorQ family protein [Bacteroidota bacterium]
MKRLSIKVVAVLGALTIGYGAQAGNPDRIGQAGATELLINSFARSSGWGAVNTAGIRGLEATQLNIAGIAYTPRTEVIFARTNWLVPSGIYISSFGLAQKLKNEGALSLSINNMSFGEIERTTEANPEGGIGTFSPQFINIGLGYSKRFSNTISGGMQVKVINEAIEDVRASGFALDAGVQYVTSSKQKSIKKDDIKFGISVRNVGPDMKYSGDGLSIKARINGNTNYDNTVENRVASFNLPSQVNIGASYDFRLDKDSNAYFHRLTAAGNFVSNSFSRNNLILGLEYAFKEFIMVRSGFVYEKDIFKDLAIDGRQTALTGFCGGVTLEVPLSKATGTTFGFDYSYRSTNPFRGIHTFGIRLNLGDK